MANTLEDDFLDDLDELEEVVQEEEAAAAALATRPSSSSSTSQNIREVGKGNGTQNVDPSESNLNSATAEAAGKTTRLLHSAKFQRLLERTSGDRSGGQSPTSSSSPSLGSLSNEELYQLVVETNEMLVSSQHELSEIHSRVAAAYDPKFPELRNLVGDNPLDFARVVRIIGNEMDVTTLEDKLAEVLPPSKVMVVSVTGSTTAGRPLSLASLTHCLAECDALLALEAARMKMLAFVEAQMHRIAPNLTKLVGANIASRLLGLAGGLAELAKVPGGYIFSLGQEKQSLKHGLSGFSSVAQRRNIGVIGETDLVLSAPPALRTKAMRVLSGKVTLATRVDAARQRRDGSLGREYRAEVASKISIWQEPKGKGRSKRALPVPGDMPARKRGGKRYRKMKERYEVTEMRKLANRVSMGGTGDEYGDDAMGYSSGSLGKGGSGRLRVGVRDTQRLAQRMRSKMERKGKGKKGRGRGRGNATSSASSASSISSRGSGAGYSLQGGGLGAAGTITGLASSVAFTPAQGIELVDPEMVRKLQAREAARASGARVGDDGGSRYFNATSGFKSVLGGKKTGK